VRRVLLVGAGEVGGKHLAALNHLAVVGIADPAPSTELPQGIPVFASWESALAKLSPELVIVAVPPGTALTVARAAAASGAAVLVEKPAVLDPAALTDADTDAGIFVAFQPHFAPGLHTLLSNPPDVERAEVSLAVRRDASYFRGWRRHFATAGGILHQQPSTAWPSPCACCRGPSRRPKPSCCTAGDWPRWKTGSPPPSP